MSASAPEKARNKYSVKFKRPCIRAAMQDGYAVQSFSFHANLEGFTGQKSDETIPRT